MRTVFVNPSYSGKFTKRSNPYVLANPGRRRRRRNPGPSLRNVNGMVRETAMISAGALGGAVLNRLGISHISNFYMRNGARVLAAALLSTMRQNHTAAIAAAGATLAPMIPEVEMQLAAATGGTKNPQELAAELADILEADLSDDMDEADLAGDDDEEW